MKMVPKYPKFTASKIVSKILKTCNHKLVLENPGLAAINGAKTQNV